VKRPGFAVVAAVFVALAVIGPGTLAAQDSTAPQSDTPAALRLLIAHAESLAEENADGVAARSAALAAALAAARAARAAFYPGVSASASGAYLLNPPAGLTLAKGSFAALPFPIPSQDLAVVQKASDLYYQGTITFKQPIVAWGKIRAAVGLADLEAQAALAERDGARLDAGREANRAYYSVKLAAESEAILGELRALAASIVADRQASLDEGLGTREELLSAKADLADLDARIVDAEEGAASAQENLAALTGLPAGTRIEAVSAYRSKLPALDEGRIEDASRFSSTDWKAAGIRLKEASKRIDLAKGSSPFLPDLAFFASLDATGPQSTWTGTWTWDLSLGLSASVDLFDGGAAAAKIDQARAERAVAEAALRGARTEARLAARRAIQAAREAEAALERAEAREAWAAEALKNARASARNELLSRQNLNAAAIREAGARLDLASARYTLEEALADLERIAPGGLE